MFKVPGKGHRSFNPDSELLARLNKSRGYDEDAVKKAKFLDDIVNGFCLKEIAGTITAIKNKPAAEQPLELLSAFRSFILSYQVAYDQFSRQAETDECFRKREEEKHKTLLQILPPSVVLSNPEYCSSFDSAHRFSFLQAGALRSVELYIVVAKQYFHGIAAICDEIFAAYNQHQHSKCLDLIDSLIAAAEHSTESLSEKSSPKKPTGFYDAINESVNMIMKHAQHEAGKKIIEETRTAIDRLNKQGDGQPNRTDDGLRASKNARVEENPPRDKTNTPVSDETMPPSRIAKGRSKSRKGRPATYTKAEKTEILASYKIHISEGKKREAFFHNYNNDIPPEEVRQRLEAAEKSERREKTYRTKS